MDFPSFSHPITIIKSISIMNMLQQVETKPSASSNAHQATTKATTDSNKSVSETKVTGNAKPANKSDSGNTQS